MNLDRAREIVIAINDRAMVTMDLPAKLDPLSDLSLADMLEAKRLVKNANAAAQAAAAVNGGGYRISVIPDDRLIAAVYTLEHYYSQPTAILAVPSGIPGRLKALAVVLAPAPGETADEDDEIGASA